MGWVKHWNRMFRKNFGLVFKPGVTLTQSDALPPNGDVSFVRLNSTTKIEATLTKPTTGQFLVITQIDAGTAGHTVTLASGTFNGTNTIATFNAAAETLVLFGVSESRFVIIENIGSVGLS
jgi:hypothetical protein